jgi:DNA-binding NtrC family response regulator
MKKRILVVDDEKNIRLTIARSLESENLVIDQAISGEEALDSLILHKYDLMILDLRLPGISGLELLEQIRELQASVPTIIISAHGTISIAVNLLKAGALDFIEKPFSPTEIRELVAKYI